MILAATTVDLTSVAVALIGGGFLTGLVALLKFKPEKDAIVVSAAQGAVVVQSGVIDALQEELDRARAEVSTLRSAVESLERELATTRAERDDFKRRLEAAEERERKLADRVAELEGH